MIANPIIRKEVLSSLRTNKAYIMQAVFLLVLAGLLWRLWPADGLQDIGGQTARKVLAVIAIGELLMVALFAASFTAASITTEKEKNTWEVLFATAMRPWEIALGKMAGSLSFLLLLVFTGAPALAALFLLGDVQGTEVLAVLGILLLTAIYLGMIGLLVSTLMFRSYRAVIVTYAIVLTVVFAAAAPAWGGLLARGGPGLQKTLHVLASISPLQAMLSVVMPESTYAAGAAGMPEYWKLFIPISILVIAGTAIAGLFKLSQAITQQQHSSQKAVIERDGKITARKVLVLLDPRKRKRMIFAWQNPMLMKEFRTRPMLQSHWLARVFGICLIISVLLMILMTFSVTVFMSESAGMISLMATAVASMMAILVMLMGPALSGGAISSDRETGIWNLIRTTKIPSWRIVSGKFQASVIPLVFFTVAMLPALLILLYFRMSLLPNMYRVGYVMGMTIMFVSTLGTFFSSIFPRTSTATACTYAVIVGMGLGTMLAMLGENLFPQQVIRIIYILNPVAAVMDAAGYPAMKAYAPLWPHLQVMGVITAVMLIVSVFRVFQLRKPE